MVPEAKRRKGQPTPSVGREGRLDATLLGSTPRCSTPHSLNRLELGKECGALPPHFPGDHGHRGDLAAARWVARTEWERVLFLPEKAGAEASSEPKSRGPSTPRDATFRGGFRPETQLSVFNLAPPPGGATRRRHVSLRRPRVGEAKRGVGRHVSLINPR